MPFKTTQPTIPDSDPLSKSRHDPPAVEYESAQPPHLDLQKIPAEPVKIIDADHPTRLNRYELKIDVEKIDAETAKTLELTQDDIEFLSQYELRLGIWTSLEFDTASDFSYLYEDDSPNQHIFTTIFGSGLSSRGDQFSHTTPIPERYDDDSPGKIDSDHRKATSLIHLSHEIFKELADLQKTTTMLWGYGEKLPDPEFVFIIIEAPGYHGMGLRDPASASLENCGSAAYARLLDLTSRILKVNRTRALFAGHSLAGEAGLLLAFSEEIAHGKRPLDIPVVAFNPSRGDKQRVFTLLKVLSQISSVISPYDNRPGISETQYVSPPESGRGIAPELRARATTALEEAITSYFLTMPIKETPKSPQMIGQINMHAQEIIGNPVFPVTCDELSREDTWPVTLTPSTKPTLLNGTEDRLTRGEHFHLTRELLLRIPGLNLTDADFKEIEGGHDSIFVSWKAQVAAVLTLAAHMKSILYKNGYRRTP